MGLFGVTIIVLFSFVVGLLIFSPIIPDHNCYLGDRKRPRQNIKESSRQQQRPQQSPHFRICRRVSQASKQVNKEREVTKRAAIDHAAYIQNELSAMIGVVEPAMNETEFVRLVMKMDGPAREYASRKRFSIGSFRLVWSRALHMTNMSSAPMPISIKERRLCTPDV